MTRATAIGLALGFNADRLLGDPRHRHPVAGFGSVASRLERVMWADSTGRGAMYTGTLVGSVVAAGFLVQRLVRDRPVPQAAVTGLVTWAVLGGRSLEKEAVAMGHLLDGPDLPRARERLAHLCSRDASGLDAVDLARATVESLAENTSDAVVAPLFWGAVAGVPGLVGYRAVNTLDAMVGYRSLRYQRFGKTSARLDDLANLVPARLTAVLTVLAAPVVGGDPAHAWAVWRRDASDHPSPNAGPVEAATAGALGVTLGGANTYHGDVEERGRLGSGRPPAREDVARGIRLCRVVSAAALAVCLAVAAVRATGGGRRATGGTHPTARR